MTSAMGVWVQRTAWMMVQRWRTLPVGGGLCRPGLRVAAGSDVRLTVAMLRRANERI
jgi:hypothetical protein